VSVLSYTIEEGAKTDELIEGDFYNRAAGFLWSILFRITIAAIAGREETVETLLKKELMAIKEYASHAKKLVSFVLSVRLAHMTILCT